MADRIDKTIIRIEADQAAANRLLTAVSKVRAEMRGTAAEVKTLGVAGGRAESELAQYGRTAQAAGKRIDGLNAEMDELRRETLAAATAQEKLERALKDTGHAAASQDFTTQYRAARQENRIESFTGSALSDVLSPLGLAGAGPARLAGDLFMFADAIPDVRLGLGRLVSSMMDTGTATKGAVAALQQYVPGMTQASAQTAVMVGSLAAMAGATAVLYVAFGKAKDIIDDSKRSLEGYMDVSQRYAELIATGTTEEVQKAIQANEDRNRALEIERGLLQGFVDAAENTTGWEGALLDLNDALGLNLGGIEDAKDKLEELDGQIGSNITLNEWLARALRDGSLATADAAAAEDELAEKRREAAKEALADIDQQVRDEAERRRKLATFTPDQVNAEITANEREIAALQGAYGALTDKIREGVLTHQEATDAADAYTARIEALEAANAHLDTTVRAAAVRREDAADAEKRLEQATKDAVDARKSAADAEVKRASLLDSYAAQTDEIERKRQLDDVREAEDLYRKQTADRAKHNQDLIALDRKHAEARAELVEKIAESSAETDKDSVEALREFQKADLRATRDYWRDMRKINRDERQSVASAARRLDASAVLEAQENAKQQREDRTEQLEAERQERAEDYQERLEELAEQRAEKRAAAAKELRDLEDQHRRERTERIRAFSQQQADEASAQRIRQQRLAQDRAYEDGLRQRQFNSELAAINSLIVAAEQLERQARATIQAGGTNPVATGGGGGGMTGTAQYYQQLAQTAAAGRYVNWSGQRVRVDQYDPQQAAGMTAAGWYDWKRRYGYQAGGYPPVGRDVLVGERGPEWVRFMQPARVYASGQTPGGGSSTTNSVGTVLFNIYESGNPQRTAEIVRQELMAIVG